MQRKYPLIAAAVSTAVLSANAMAAPTLTQAQAATTSGNYLVIAGSSAAQPGFAALIENDLCGGASNTLVIRSGLASGLTNANKNFWAYSCATNKPVGSVASGTIVTIYYRSEGGSVTGAVPIASGNKINRLNLGDSSCTTIATGGANATCSVSGLSSVNGTQDTWNGAVTEDFVQLGVTDVEPSQLVGADSPFNNSNVPSNYNYNPAVYGTVTAKQLGQLQTAQAFQQVFGIYVNVSGLGIGTSPAAGGTAVVNLSRESVANILTDSYTDWSNVPDAKTGNPVSSTSNTITRIDREPGSGSRTATNLYFLGTGCGQTAAIKSSGKLPGSNTPDSNPLTFSTGDELKAANNTPGAIAYGSIDNLASPISTTYTNLVLATINGTAPSTLTAAAGAYDFWYDATLVIGNTTGAASALSSYIQTAIPTLPTITAGVASSGGPLYPDINFIPYIGTPNNTPTVGLTSASGTFTQIGTTNTGTATVYVNPFDRGSSSCNIPSELNE